MTERPRLTAIRAWWLFDGTGPGLIANPVVVLDGATIRSAQAGGVRTTVREHVERGWMSSRSWPAAAT